MKRLLLRFATACVLGAAAVPGMSAPVSETKAVAEVPTSIRLRFVNTDVSDILQAIGLRTHANIVFPAELKKPVSLDITASSVGEALAYTTAAAGLAFRRVGRTYVVGNPDDLRRLLEPFGEKARLDIGSVASDDAVKLLTSALPYLTVRPAGNQVSAIGTPDDIQEARDILAQQERTSPVDPPTTCMISLQHTVPVQVATLLKSMYPLLRAESIGQPDKPGGAIGLAGPKSQVDRAKDAAQKLDSPVESGPEHIFHLYHVRYTSVRGLISILEGSYPNLVAMPGPQYASPRQPIMNSISATVTGGATAAVTATAAASGSPPVDAAAAPLAAGTVPPPVIDEHVRTLVLSGTKADIDAALRLLALVDVAPQQVLIEVKVLDTSPEHAEKLGVQWSWNPLNFVEGNQPITTGTNVVQPNTTTNGYGAISHMPMQATSVIDGMIQDKSAKLLAHPKIVVVDNDDASIFIGDNIWITVSQASVSGTTTQLIQFQVGIILLVRPHIGDDGKIMMRVHPVVSTITGYGTNSLPLTSSREAETTVLINDGETIVIGGLIQDQVTKTISAVPYLSKLPIVGALFRDRSTDHTHSEVLVSITTHIVKDGQGPMMLGGAPLERIPARAGAK